MTYRYFISYTCQAGPVIGFGHTEIRLPDPITGIADLKQVHAMLADQGVPNALVLNFARFDEPLTPARLDEV